MHLLTVLHCLESVHDNPLKPKLNFTCINSQTDMESSTASLPGVAVAYNITDRQIYGNSLMFWLRNANIIHNPEANVDWDVYLFSRGNIFHYCLLFRSVDTGNSFFVDLVLIDGGRRVDFRMMATNAAVDNLRHLGRIRTSMLEILYRAHVVIRNFGPYIGLGHNCQHYVANLTANLAADFGNLQAVHPSSDLIVAIIIIGVVLRVILQI